MSPAPGPLTPPVSVESIPLTLTQDATSSASANSDARSDLVTSAVSATVQVGPKTCTCCGGLLELPIDTSSGNGTASAQWSSELSQGLSTIGIRSRYSREDFEMADGRSSTSTLNDVRQVDQDRSQLCASCITSRQQEQQHQQELHQEASQATSHPSQLSANGNSDDTEMSHAGPSRPSMARSNSSAETSSALQTNTPDPTTPTHPWRRQAPWTIDRSRSSDDTSNAHGEPLLTISTRGVGAGGDAINARPVLPEDEFPPLERSPSLPGGSFTATSPRLPLSPTRARGSYNSNPPQSPTPLGRQPSFSRSQNAVQAGAAAAVAPVVNVPSRGRVRAGSSSGQGVSALQGANRGRRLSTTRRLSRSSSSQGPTAVSFADLASTSQGGSALLDDTIRTCPIEEDPFGPRSMTRTRLSALLAHDAKKERTHGSGVEKRNAIDYRTKPFVAPMMQNSNGSQADDEQDGKARYLLFMNCSKPDPRIDISLVRSDPVRRGCLYPGATFRGTQKSGRTSYDVSVQIVNVDLAASHLCGYLNIRGLTDDWPELTTYFDAEIIGQRYGFLTGKWGATEADDMKHWGRFTPFRPMRSTLTRPGLRFNHMNKPYVFMRWKERFLVPDHRVRDISGASFAGFYYVCVELGEEAETVSQSLTSPASPVSSPGAPPVRGRADTMDSGGFGSTDVAMTTGDAAPSNTFFNAADISPSTSGRMSGFYFHEHSEPYQQLTLRHVSESSSSTFELR